LPQVFCHCQRLKLFGIAYTSNNGQGVEGKGQEIAEIQKGDGINSGGTNKGFVKASQTQQKEKEEGFRFWEEILILSI